MGPNMPVLKCRRTDTLHRALELLAAAGDKFERLVCTDDAGRCTGVVTIGDLFEHFCRAGEVPWRTEGFAEARISLVGGAAARGEDEGGGGGSGGGGGGGGEGVSRIDSVGLALEKG